MTPNKAHKRQVEIVRNILFEEHLNGSIDLDRTAKRIVAAIFCNNIKKSK